MAHRSIRCRRRTRFQSRRTCHCPASDPRCCRSSSSWSVIFVYFLLLSRTERKMMKKLPSLRCELCMSSYGYYDPTCQCQRSMRINRKEPAGVFLLAHCGGHLAARKEGSHLHPFLASSRATRTTLGGLRASGNCHQASVQCLALRYLITYTRVVRKHSCRYMYSRFTGPPPLPIRPGVPSPPPARLCTYIHVARCLAVCMWHPCESPGDNPERSDRIFYSSPYVFAWGIFCLS